jgi:hypothetical protein
MADTITVVRAGAQIEGGDNDYVNIRNATWNESGLVTATSDPVDLGGPRLIEGALVVSALTGTLPELDVVIETSPNGSTGWVAAKAYTQATGATSETPLPFPVHQWIRIERTYGGTVTASSASWVGKFVA